MSFSGADLNLTSELLAKFMLINKELVLHILPFELITVRKATTYSRVH